MSRATPLFILVGIAILTGCSDDKPTPTAPRAVVAARPNVSLATGGVVVGPPIILEGLDGSSYAIAHAINGLGDVAGVSANGNQAVLWKNGSKAPTDLGFGVARDINAAGQLVGDWLNKAVVWTPTDRGWYTTTDIGDQLPGALMSAAYGVNERGQVVGSFMTSPKPGVVIHKCFLWTPVVIGPLSAKGTTGTVTILDDLGGSFCVANDINSDGHIAGASNTPPDENGIEGTHAFVWSPSTPNGTTGTTYDLTRSSIHGYAVAINDGRQVVGQRLANDVLTAALWTPTWGGGYDVSDLGTYTGTESFALDVNDAGFVVGVAQHGDNVDAFIWRNGAFTTLGGVSSITEPTALTNVKGTTLSVVGASFEPGSGHRNALRWEVSLAPLGPSGCSAQLMTAVKPLEAAGALQADEAQSVVAKLDASTRQMGEHRPMPARHLAESFVRDVKAFVSSGRITDEQALPLINFASCATGGR